MRDVRHWTNLLFAAIENDLISAEYVAEIALRYMSESEVEDMCRCNDLQEYLDPESANEDDPDDPKDDWLDDFNYVGSRHHY